MQDLYKSKKEQLLDFIRQKGYFTSHDVNYFGATHFYDSATRRIREWTEEGIIRRLPEDEKIFRGFKTKCGVYEIINKSFS